MEKYIVGIGAANVDITGKSKKPLNMKDSNPGYMHVSIGGVTRNVLENLARLGTKTKLVSAIGNDLYGKMIVNYSNKAGIDTSESLRVDNCTSSIYLAILNNNGDMHLALSDMHIIDNITVDYLKTKLDIIKNAVIVTFDPCLPEETIKFITEEISKTNVIFCDPVSTSYASRVKPYIGNIHTVKPNRMELAILADHPTDTFDDVLIACKILIDKGVKQVFVSNGKEGALYYDCNGNYFEKALKPIEDMVNASGAGDSFMAGIIYSYLNGFSAEKTMKTALACGSAAIMAEATINPDLGLDMINKILERG